MNSEYARNFVRSITIVGSRLGALNKNQKHLYNVRQNRDQWEILRTKSLWVNSGVTDNRTSLDDCVTCDLDLAL
jgi:hypothetical protein